MILNFILKVTLGALVCVGVASCFTGVESTPRIGASTVREQHAASVSAEATYLDDILPQPPSLWHKGKKFRVADDRIQLIFSSPSDPADRLVGQDISFYAIDRGSSLTGGDAAVIVFSDDRGGRYYYRPANFDQERIDSVIALEIPFTIDLDLVKAIDRRMRGKQYYVRTPLWYSADSTLTPQSGLRHVEISVDSVVPGTSNFPAAVCFHSTNPELITGQYVLLMGVGKGRGTTRTFDNLFAFDNPRKQYPEIKDEIWAKIIRSQVQKGMTRDECRLALGQPTDILRIPTYGGMQERWTYSDGIYLIFDDGYLTNYRR